MRLRTRRAINLTLALLAAAAIAVGLTIYWPTLRSTYYVTGWTLAGMMVFLAGYNLRKKLAYPSLLSSRLWLQLHVYIGLLSILVFAFHIGWALPNGPFEVTLALLYVAVAGSGLVGLGLSRLVPAMLSSRGEEVLFERIPIFRRRLRDRAEELAVDSVERFETTTISDFYGERLAEFFRRPKHTMLHLLQSGRPRRRLTTELHALHRYLNDEERRVADELEDLIEAKDLLDYNRAMQGLLKGWLFVHIPLTYALLAFMVLHAVLVHTFIGAGS